MLILTRRVTLDELDIGILNSLSKNCRISYDQLSSQVGLTAKSIKARVKKMQSDGIIHNFVVKLNPRVLDYNRSSLLTVRFNQPHDERNIVHSINLIGDIIGRLDGISSVSAFLIAVKVGFEKKLDLLLNGLGQNLVQNHDIILPDVIEQPSTTDFKIMKCLFTNPRMEISDIANEISMSSKTVSRRLEKMVQNKILEFSVLCNLSVMPGYIISIVSVSVDKTSYQKVLENSYADLLGSFLLRSPFMGQDNIMIFIVCSKDTRALDSFALRLKSYTAVKKVDVFITTRIDYHQNVILNEIDKKLNHAKRSKSLILKEIPNIH